MAESVQVRCPECLRTLRYAAPAFPCSCGTPIAPPVIPGSAAVPVVHRNWSDEWVTVQCPACARRSDWPHPEVGCACGAVLRVPVRAPGEGYGESEGYADGAGPGGRGAAPRVPPQATAERPRPGAGGGSGPGGGSETGGGSDTGPSPHRVPEGSSPFIRRHPSPSAASAAARDRRPVPEAQRTAFRPVTIRTARDAVAASAGYLRWLGFRHVVQPEERSASGVDLRGPGLVAQVDPSTRPTGLRAVECLWLNGLSSAAVSVCFSLAGYTAEAHERADGLGIPLFVLDLTGTPQPVNAPAGELLAGGAP
ncbi:hypothetical protein [Streptomyces sp. NPDC048623]|uniref:hypothetical protein n=1 Tax=Streptomyces sp. NPDC048623 TaxID=3155761 RepID=UPI00341CFE74